MAAIDEASTDQHEPVEFLTADDLQGITGQLDQLLTGQTSLESKFDLYTSDALDRLTGPGPSRGHRRPRVRVRREEHSLRTGYPDPDGSVREDHRRPAMA